MDGYAVATWSGLLQHGVKYCKEIGAADEKAATVLAMQIESGETDFLVSAAETISQRLKAKSPGVFRGWLKNTVGNLSVKDPAILGALHALPGVLATLNYDGLIEQATKRQAITWLKADKTQEVLRRELTNAVLHLHGWFDEPESVVLGLSSYLAVRDHPHARAVLDLFTLDRTLLFVGCGDTVLDPNFTRLIEWSKAALIDVSPRHFLLCRTAEVADFQNKLTEAPWLQLLDYGADYPDLVPFLRSLAPLGGVATLVNPPAAPAFDLILYQQAMRKRYGRLKLEELDPTTHDIRALTLTDVFIAQGVRECAEFMPRVFELPKELQRRLREAGEMQDMELDEETLAQHRRAYVDQSPRPVLEVVSDSSLTRLVILGDPGSGKSTLLQYLLLQWAEKTTFDLQREPLPLLIELREYARLRHEGEVEGFFDYLHSGASVRWHLDKVQLVAWLKSNPNLVLFDGLDEIFDPGLRREVSTAIHRLADEFPRARIVVTSRIIGFQHQSWRDEGFRHFMLQELDDAQIGNFLTRWHLAAYEEPSAGEAKRALLARAIEESAAISQLAGNPLLLTMMAILNRTQDLPRDRAELYEQCSRLLLHQWKVDVAFAPDPELAKVSLDFKDKRGLLLRVARTMQATDRGLAGNLLDVRSLESTFAEGLKGIPNLRSDRAARALIEQLRGRNFMLCSVGGQFYAFVHRTFLEYFCALEIRERFQTEQTLTIEQLKLNIFGHWTDESWHEVLCLLSGMLAPRFVAQILGWLLVQPDHGETCQHVLLAARCVGEVRKRVELGAIAQEILTRTQALVRFDLSHYYESVDDEATTVAAIRSRAVSTVGAVWRGRSDVHTWLKARAQYDEDSGVRQSAVQELARGWKDDPETLSILKARAQSDVEYAVCRSAMQELARGWKDDPDTLPWLKARVQSDEGFEVRCNAVRELARGWKNDPETLPILKARAQFDKDRLVRRDALQELASGWKNDPETLPILKASARFDKDRHVRKTAVEQLASGWNDDPDTLPWLKARAQSDEDFEERSDALQELASGWKNDPETLPILKACAKFDEHYLVRFTAVQELAHGWKDDLETLPIVKACAQADENSVVRGSIVFTLLAWRGARDVHTWLKALAQSEEDHFVRGAAVLVLALGWKDDPETLPILKALARSDEDSHVRQHAMQELARGWKDDPDTLPILKALARSDEDSHVRQHAVQELARRWKDDPDTLPILKVRAQSDEDSDVRQRAVQVLASGWKGDPEVRTFLSGLAELGVHQATAQPAL